MECSWPLSKKRTVMLVVLITLVLFPPFPTKCPKGNKGKGRMDLFTPNNELPTGEEIKVYDILNHQYKV